MMNERPEASARLTRLILSLIDDLQLEAEVDCSMPAPEQQAWAQARQAVENGRLRFAFVAHDEDARSLAGWLNRRLHAATTLDADYTSATQAMIDHLGFAMGVEDQGGRWDERGFFTALAATLGPEEVGAAYALLGWARDRGLPIRWSETGGPGSFTPWLGHAAFTYEPLTIDVQGGIVVHVDALLESNGFGADSVQQELSDRVGHVAVPDAEGHARTHLSSLGSADALESFIGALDWIVDTIQSS